MKLILVLAACCVALSACDAPGLRLRSDYAGRPWLEPNLQPGGTPRDALGNPILPPPTPPVRSTWPVFRGP
jgi:hypothetical protein